MHGLCVFFTCHVMHDAQVKKYLSHSIKYMQNMRRTKYKIIWKMKIHKKASGT